MKPIRKRVVFLAAAAVLVLAGAELGRGSLGAPAAGPEASALPSAAEPDHISAESFARLHGFGNADWVTAFSSGWR